MFWAVPAPEGIFMGNTIFTKRAFKIATAAGMGAVRAMVKLDLQEYERDFLRKLEKAKKRIAARQTNGGNAQVVSAPGSEKANENVDGPRFKFIDLFAGIGGYRLPLEAAGGRCVFSSEIDSYSRKTYKAWFREAPHGDITKIPAAEIPEHDILAAGFPCQPFSIAGVSKKISLGHAHGFDCDIQGTLFFNVASIIEVKRPAVVLLENVKNLQSHDGGRTWRIIRETLEALEYNVFAQIIDAVDYVPQHRERIFIVCFDRHVFGDHQPFVFPPKPLGPKPQLRDILDPNPDPKYTLSEHLWNYLQAYAARHKAKGNGFGFGLANLDSHTRTLSARYYKDGSEILIPQHGKSPRRLTPRECARLMGFPETLPIVVSDTQAYRQFGNAIVPAVAEAVIKNALTIFDSHIEHSPRGFAAMTASAG
jgi:DNA (cytosine-5)-methyltransferase 1